MAKPSLAQSIPKECSEFDDDLLTASEVAELKLNADWVLLSACNTIAGDSPGAEALSGLARAFFYAGATAPLVTHWAVTSEAVTQLTTSTFGSPEGRCLFVAQRRRRDRPCWPMSTTRHRTGTPLRPSGDRLP
jgi:CHAT domain